MKKLVLSTNACKRMLLISGIASDGIFLYPRLSLRTISELEGELKIL